MTDHRFVKIGSGLYVFGSLDEINRVFVGYRLTKDLVTKIINDEIDDVVSYENKTTILFREQGDDVYIYEAELDDFKHLYNYNIPEWPHFGYVTSEEEYNEALKAKEVIIRKPWWKPKFIYLRRINKIINIINEYENQQFQLNIYNERISEREEWLLRVKEMWFE